MCAMTRFEYKVVPAPRRGEKIPGAKTTPERFAVALSHVMNTLAAEGWEYLRADTLPCDERAGLTGTATHFQNMLVFRRALHEATLAALPDLRIQPALVPETGQAAPTLSGSHAAEGPAPALGPATHPNGPAA